MSGGWSQLSVRTGKRHRLGFSTSKSILALNTGLDCSSVEERHLGNTGQSARCPCASYVLAPFSKHGSTITYAGTMLINRTVTDQDRHAGEEEVLAKLTEIAPAVTDVTGTKPRPPRDSPHYSESVGRDK